LSSIAIVSVSLQHSYKLLEVAIAMLAFSKKVCIVKLRFVAEKFVKIFFIFVYYTTLIEESNSVEFYRNAL